MANDLKENKNKNGIYIRGDVISNSAKIVKMKDSTTRVSVKHEIALEPGILVLDQLLDPFNDNRVKIDGDEVKSFPTLEKFQSILVRTNRLRSLIIRCQLLTGKLYVVDQVLGSGEERPTAALPYLFLVYMGNNCLG